jgi:signal peptidase I
MTKARTVVSLAAQTAVLVLIAGAFFLRTPQVDGMSMEPRVRAGEIVLIDTLGYRIKPIRRGDVVAFRHDAPNPETYIKRVIGMPGDRIEVRDGRVYIDGSAIAEPYVQFRDHRSAPALTVPAESFYVLGDNRADSDDSRNWGVLGAHDLVGRAVVGLWPPHRV